MEQEIYDEIKSKVGIREIVSYFYQEPNRDNKLLCPFHTEKTPSFSIEEKENIFKCFGCDKGGDGITFVAQLKQISNYEAAKLIDDAFNLGVINKDNKPTKQVKRVVPKPKPKEPEEEKEFVPDPEIKDYILRCIPKIGQQTYMQDTRGLTLETLKKFKVGYDDELDAIVMPYNNSLTYYQRRTIQYKSFYKPETEKAGPEPIYNERALNNKTRTPIFIVESPMCAMSVSQEGGVAIATGGTGCSNKLAKALDKYKPNGAMILSFDNDDSGEKANKEISELLTKKGIKHLTYNICPDYKDPNEMLVVNKAKFQQLIQGATFKAKQLTATKYDLHKVSDLQQTELPPIRWIIEDLLPEGLSMIAAGSKMGKSWMGQQICIEVARGGKVFDHQANQCSTVYLALEDSDRRVKSRANVYMKGNIVPPGYTYSIHAPTLDTGLIDCLEMYLLEDPKIGFIVIDTLQKVRGAPLKNENAYATDYRELGILKEFADKHHIGILLLHHTRKMKDENDAFNMINGTNGVMGVLDTIWLLYKKNRTDADATLLITGRDVEQQELVISKGDKNGRWDYNGTAEAVEENHRRENYDKNPIVRTIKGLLEKNPGGWQGTVKQFKEASVEILNDGTRLESDTKVGMEISKLSYELRLDGIIHEYDEKRTRLGKRHRFFKKNPYNGEPMKGPEFTQTTFNI